MNDRQALMRNIQAIGLSMYDLHLFLDTHPEDRTALELYKRYRAKYDALVGEYERQYGPLTAGSEASTRDGWRWVEDPWPWEITANEEA